MIAFVLLMLSAPFEDSALKIRVDGEGGLATAAANACAAVERRLGAAKEAFRVTVRVAVSTDAFVETTQRPRFEAAALVDRTIHLQPEHVLERRPDLAAILEHECVHVWLRAQLVPPLAVTIEESVAAGFSGQGARLPPLAPLLDGEIALAEHTLRHPESKDAYVHMLGRAYARFWPRYSSLTGEPLIRALQRDRLRSR